MDKGICHIAQIPLRGEPRSSAEMVSQLLFGETYSILRTEGEWSLIKMDYDGYEGWLSESSISEYSSTSNRTVQSGLLLTDLNDIAGGTVISSMGSELNIVDGMNHRLYVQDLAKKFLGTPYLWGGRHFSGIDCSGFVQIIYKVIGVALPRDASQQQKVGKPVPFDNLFVGDLVFFEKNERVMHVGMIIEKGKIIHSHGKVRIDTLTKDGIVNSDSGKKTHSYHSAKRLR
ncbi:MAG: NlpC/P60 family protein [Bacteroidia bacterium]